MEPWDTWHDNDRKVSADQHMHYVEEDRPEWSDKDDKRFMLIFVSAWLLITFITWVYRL